MYDPEPNLRNCCIAGYEGYGEEEMMAVEKDSEIALKCLLTVA